MYNLLYRKIITKLPDKYVEFFGGFFMRVATVIHSCKATSFPIMFQGLTFHNPVGIPSGWADTPQKVRSLAKLGAGIIVIKTITAEEKIGNPYPRIIRKGESLINSLGLPNKGLVWWQKYFESHSDLPHPIIVSIKGNSVAEWQLLLQTFEQYVDIIELNFSCPNIDNGIMDLDQSVALVQQIAQFCTKPLLLKLSPEYSAEQNLVFVQQVKSLIAGVSLINTMPTFHAKLGNPKKIGGQSGPIIHSLLLDNLQKFRNVYPKFSDLAIFASGGINEYNCVQIIRDYKAIPLVLTRFLTHGPSTYCKMVHAIQLAFTPEELQLHLS